MIKTMDKKGTGTERKITAVEFLAFLRNNGGVYSRTARAITEHLKKITGDPDATYSRQAVKYRAELLSEDVLDDIEDETWDLVAGGLHDALKSDDQGIKLKAVHLGMKYLGHKYGVTEHRVHEHKNIRVIIGDAGTQEN
jgi:predicted DNA-binding protein (UPF0278 family)